MFNRLANPINKLKPRKKKLIMNNLKDLDADCCEDLSSKKVFAIAICTGLLFWSSLFGIIIFAIRS